MLSNVANVAIQVVELFILMGAGVLCGRVHWLDDIGAKQMTAILFKLVTFCVIVESFLTVSFSYEKLNYMAAAAGACFICTVIGALFTLIFFRKEEDKQKTVLKFGTVFSNSGFMSLPLVSALLGAEGVFVVSIYVAVFQCLIWTYGVGIYHYFDRTKVMRQIMANPGIISVIVGLPLFLLQITCPKLLLEPIGMLADLNTPIAMLITGYYLSKMTFRLQPGDGQILLATLLRLVCIPILVFGVLYGIGLRGFLLTACIIPVCAPTASNTSLFAVLFHADEVYASRLVSLCTLCSIVTMPVLIALAQSTGK